MNKHSMKDKTQDKVKILHEKGYVPPSYLAEINPFIYAILSKGVHQLRKKERM